MHGLTWVIGAVATAIIALMAHESLLGFRSLYGLFGNGVDAIVYRYGGATVLDTESLYSFTLFESALPFTYPPFAALLFVPLAALSVPLTIVAVALANAALLYLAVLLSWRMLGYRGAATHVVSICMAVAMTWLEPVRMTMWLGQINLLLLVAVLWDLGRPEGSRLRGFGVGIAAGLKLTPAFFVLHALAQRQWSTVRTACISFGATVVLGFLRVFNDATTFWTSAIFQSDRVGLLRSPANQSIHGMLARMWSNGAPPFALWICCAVVIGGLGLWAASVAQRRGQQLLSLTVCGLTTPMVSPFSWGHHWVWCVPLTVLVVHHASRACWLIRLVVPATVLVPFAAWFYTTSDGVAVIGTFMQRASGPVAVLAGNAYPLVFAAVLLAVGAKLGASSRVSAHDGSPRLEFAFERHRRERGAGGRESDEVDLRDSLSGTHISPKAALSLGAVEENSLDGRVRRDQRREVVGLDRGLDDRRVEAPVPSTQLQHIPHGDAAA